MKGVVMTQITFEEKPDVGVYTCVIPYPIDATVVCLNVDGVQEKRYRTEVGGGTVGRITVSQKPHYQKEKLHPGLGLYIVQKGWVAILTKDGDTYNVDIGFAGADNIFFVMAPANVWYGAFLSGPVAFTYAASNNVTGQVREYEKPMPSESEILELFGQQHRLKPEDVAALVIKSMQ
jgi:hypothetical protein